MKNISLALAVISLAVALGLTSAWVADAGRLSLLGLPVLVALAALAFLIQWLAFIPAFKLQTEHFYDLTGSLTYLTLTAIACGLTLQNGAHPIALLLSALIAVWAIRLGSFLFARVRRVGKDARFDEIKVRGPRFLVAWTLQGLWVFLTAFAALIAITNEARALDIWALSGGLLWLAGFAFEVVADSQKSRFKANPANADQFINSGLWAWSRHPNYFGEILLWLGIAIIAAPSFQGWQWIGLISPLFVALLIIKLSGVALLEKRGHAKWGDQAAYQQYCEATPVLIPRPPRG